MAQVKASQWKNVYDFVKACGSIHEPYEFCVQTLLHLKQIIGFDQGLILFLDKSRKIMNQYLLNIDKDWNRMYLEYYSRSKDIRFNLFTEEEEQADGANIRTIDWEQVPLDEFIVDYIRIRELRYSLCFTLFDLDGSVRAAFSMDRTGLAEPFSDDDIQWLRLIVPPISNLYKNFYASALGKQNNSHALWYTEELTDREAEVLSLFCWGLNPENIGKELHIATSTVNKHVSHIYKKMHVSNRQELLIRMFTSYNYTPGNRSS